MVAAREREYRQALEVRETSQVQAPQGPLFA